MKRILIALLSVILCAFLLASCPKDPANEQNTLKGEITNYFDVPYQYDLTSYIEITRDDYVGVEVTKVDTTVTDEDLNDAIYTKLDEAGTLVDVTDRGAENGDTLVIDFKGSVDGEYFSGGEATDYEMVLGEAGFIDGFEEALVGHKAGESFNINVTFPEGYSEELGGKDAVFEITMKSVKTKVLPEFNLDFIKVNSEFTTVEEYLAFVTEELVEAKADEAKSAKIDEAFGKIYDNVVIKDYPKDEYDFYYNDYVGYYEGLAETYGVDLKTFITELAGSTEQEFYKYADTNAQYFVTQELIVYSIAKNEGILEKITKADYDEYLLELAELYDTDGAGIEAQYGTDEVWKSLISDKIFDFILENSVEVEPAEEDTKTETTEVTTEE